MAAEKYGVHAQLLDSLASTPVDTSTNVVFIGTARIDRAKGYPETKNTDENESDEAFNARKNDFIKSRLNRPILITSMKDFEDKLNGHDSADDPKKVTLLDAAKAAFEVVGISKCWMINVYNPATDGEFDNYDSDDLATAVEGTSEAVSGVYAVNLMHPEHGAVADVICCPNCDDGGVLDAIKAVATNQNGHWKGIGVYGVTKAPSTQLAGALPNVGNVKSGKGVSDESLVAVWPDVKAIDGATVSGASVVAALYAANDAKQLGGVPVRTIGNTALTIRGIDCGGSTVVMQETTATALSGEGIVTFLNHGGGNYSTWGDHTSAVINGEPKDERARYDSNMRVLYYLMNRFQQKYRFTIDKPMTLSLRNDILQEQNDHLEYLKSIGAVIGNARCEFRAESNPADAIALGQFVWNIEATVTPPMKYAELDVSFTQAGYSVYYE